MWCGMTFEDTVFPHIRPAGTIFLNGLQLRALLEITKFHLHKSVPGGGIIRNAGIIRGRVLYEEIRYTYLEIWHCLLFFTHPLIVNIEYCLSAP